MLQQTLVGSIGGEHPVVEFKHEVSTCESVFSLATLTTHDKHLFRSDIGEKFVYIVDATFGTHKFACRDIQESHATAFIAEVNAGKEVVLTIVENIVVDADARSDKLGDATLYELLGHLRVFELLADSHTLSGSDQFRQIGVEGMVRKTGKLHILSRTIGTTSQRDTEYLACSYGIFRKGLIEVAHSEEQDSIGMLVFHLDVLFHQRGFGYLCHLLCHNLLFPLIII